MKRTPLSPAAFAPQLVHETVDRDHLVGVQQQQREQRALFRTAQRKRLIAFLNLEGPENHVLHRAPFLLQLFGNAMLRPRAPILTR